ncbi:MAG: TraB/GumN family protein [Marinicaulis sp.]|nr:TraB/GumN family protein [Marinicaulis sp.]NNL90417.1 TraB/GumN family protein [Marinicaulis sp.]
MVTNMRKLFGSTAVKLFAASLFAAPGAVAQEAAPVDVSAIANATPAMWRVTDEDSEFILLGTFHILPPGLEWRTDALNKAMEKADTVYFEVEADTPDAQTKTIGIMMMEGFNEPGVTLTEMLDENDAAKLKTISTSLNLPIAAIDPMRPWNAFLTLSVSFIVKQGFDPASGVDSVLSAQARTLGKKLQYFETIEEQIGFFTGLAPETEKSLLEITLREWENQVEEFDDLFAAWAYGDVNFIDEEMNTSMREEAPEVYATLITERNEKWVERIAADMDAGDGTALVAVGAAHLVGEDSLPTLLKAKGFDVSRYGIEEDATSDDNDSEPETASIDLVNEDADDIVAPMLAPASPATEFETDDAANDNKAPDVSIEDLLKTIEE